MSVPPIPSSGSIFPGSMPNVLVEQFYTLWQSWYFDDNPLDQVKNGTKLLQFLEKNHNYFEELAAKNPNPQHVTFANSYSAAINTLSDWLQQGVNPDTKVIPSEFVNDVYDWVVYVNQ